MVVVRYRLAGACNFWHPKHRVLKDEREPLPWPVPSKVHLGRSMEFMEVLQVLKYGCDTLRTFEIRAVLIFLDRKVSL